MRANWHKLCYFMDLNASGILLHLFTKTNKSNYAKVSKYLFDIHLVSWMCAEKFIKSPFGFNFLVYWVGVFK